MKLTIEMFKSLKDNDGLTLKNYKTISYKTGWQVATEGKETRDVNEAFKMIEEYNGNCGVWLSNGVYYIDKSIRVNTKTKAMEIGRKCSQISILGWKNMKLAYC